MRFVFQFTKSSMRTKPWGNTEACRLFTSTANPSHGTRATRMNPPAPHPTYADNTRYMQPSPSHQCCPQVLTFSQAPFTSAAHRCSHASECTHLRDEGREPAPVHLHALPHRQTPVPNVTRDVLPLSIAIQPQHQPLPWGGRGRDGIGSNARSPQDAEETQGVNRHHAHTHTRTHAHTHTRTHEGLTTSRAFRDRESKCGCDAREQQGRRRHGSRPRTSQPTISRFSVLSMFSASLDTLLTMVAVNSSEGSHLCHALHACVEGAYSKSERERRRR